MSFSHCLHPKECQKLDNFSQTLGSEFGHPANISNKLSCPLLFIVQLRINIIYQGPCCQNDMLTGTSSET